MRMVELSRGKIEIDNQDISDLGLHKLRKNLMIIPQDPTIFSGTLRFNLDPFLERSDAELFDALKHAQMLERLQGTRADTVSDDTGTSSSLLDMEVSEGGGNFSYGERQLIALARAILRKPKAAETQFQGILLLDEATSALDPELDRTIQRVLRQEFSGATLITIAHRLATIQDYDRVAVLDQGKVVEFGDPRMLLRDSRTAFSKMSKGSRGDGLNEVGGTMSGTAGGQWNW